MRKLIFTILAFTLVNYLLAQAPTISSFTPISGPVGTLVTITGTNLSNPTALAIGGVSALPISNTATNLVAMVMPGAVTGSIGIITAGGSVSSSSNFTVVTSLPPNTQQGNKLFGTGVVGNASQGISVDISADGNTAVVGGYTDNYGIGAAWIFIRNAGIWSQQGSKLVGTGNIGAAEQGWAVAISSDGNTIVLGGHNDNNLQGAAWVFTRQAGIWSQQGNKLVGIGGLGMPEQGYSVDISGDGNTILLGGYADNSNQGAIWVFARNAGVWGQQGNKLVGSGNIGKARQGMFLNISLDGNFLVEGGCYDNNNQGAAWVFAKNNGVWAQQGSKLVGSGGSSWAYQGRSVSINGDGSSLVTGGFADNSNQGGIWIFTRTGNAWTQQGAKLLGTGVVGGYASQGYTVSMSADGNTVLSSGLDDNSGKGATWIFTRTGASWSQQGSKLVGANATAGTGHGYALSISANGNTAIIGAYDDNTAQGTAWLFTNPSFLPTSITNLKAFQKNTAIQVEWKVTNETNLSSYQVEKSTNGIAFTNLGTVTANGSSAYQLLDASPLKGDNFYRLKMMDKDGSFKYSSIVNVKIGGIKNAFTIAGNPIRNGQLVLQLENVEKGSFSLSLYNSQGQQTLSRTIVHEGGSATQTLYLGTVSAGTYQLSIIGNNVKTSKTILVD